MLQTVNQPGLKEKKGIFNNMEKHLKRGHCEQFCKQSFSPFKSFGTYKIYKNDVPLKLVNMSELFFILNHFIFLSNNIVYNINWSHLKSYNNAARI